ncbi:MarR family winged helix-turn-helix transcriptional regulator [Carboxydothermus ferrireducens]|uniref:DNA-binding MarR family transcriptional regulator n=1 Tax=Carboxydothermus ferrireducens DSM 11255 TaxID=1119529 RepID=A0ABX2R6Z6_9THEO|nr:MarR family transcriptional regulator [Carboxydothermus ferrireducens]NYE56690.1 DNA-binding MarR family transcriptional regulator [Carboxydothermus ferrireducens DSM 11255]
MNINEELKQKLTEELVRTVIQFKKGDGFHGQRFGIKKSELILLATMREMCGEGIDGVKVSDLSQRLNITPAAVTHMLNSLEEGGYIERIRDAKDRRIVMVRPSAKGKEILEQGKKEILKRFSGLVEYLGEKDTSELIRLLNKASYYFREVAR